MKGRLLNLAAAAALLLFVGTVVLWPASCRSWPIEHWWEDRRNGAARGVFVWNGNLSFQSVRDIKPATGDRVIGGFRHERLWTFAGLQYEHRTYVARTWEGKALPGTYGSHRVLWITLAWPLALAAAAPPLIWLRHRLHRRRRGPSRRPPVCDRCGYDLRATPQRCPECGRPAECAPGTEAAPRDRGA